MDARKRRPGWEQCDGKERYASPQVAAKVAKRRNARRKRSGKWKHVRPLQSYHCPRCGFFHLGGVGP